MRHLLYIVFVAAIFVLSAPEPVAAQESGLSVAEERRQSRLFDRHVVKMGETAFSIARGYAISPTTLAEDNPDVELVRLRVGQVLMIRKRERGKTTPDEVARQWELLTNGGLQQGGGQQDESWPDGGQQDRMQSDTEEPDVASPFEMYAPRTENGIPDVALMLPLEGSGAVISDLADFYRGALLAFEDQKALGRSMNVTLYNSARSPEKVMEIVTSSEFSDTDLIIGPVYESEIAPAVEFGRLFGVPVVSPLAPVRELDSDALYLMAPDPATKYDKLREMFGSGGNIILVSSVAGDDAEFEREITNILGVGNYGRFTLTGTPGTRVATNAGEIASLIDWERENIFIVLGASEPAVDHTLASISSAYTNASDRRGRRADITVLGSSKWAGYNSVDKNLFFKLGVKFVTSYYINHTNPATANFERRFIEAYGNLPSRSALRGYDAVALFAGAIFENGFSFADKLGRMEPAPLGTPYNFVQKGDSDFWGRPERGRGNHTNDSWTVVEFTHDYNIIIL